MNLEEERMLKGGKGSLAQAKAWMDTQAWTLVFNYKLHFACRLFFAFGICTFIKHFDDATPSQQTHES
jgi:hypothetical protein